MTIKLNGSTAGSVALDAPASTTGNADITFKLPIADGTAGQVLQTDGSGTLSFAESGGGGGGNNTAVKQFSHFKLGTTSTVVDEFDIKEYRGAIYDVAVEDVTNSFIGHLKVSLVHDDTSAFICFQLKRWKRLC